MVPRLALCFFCAQFLYAQSHDDALSPEAELKTFQHEAGLEVELAAAEPLVVAPVAISFDEQGRMFVAENRGYPEQERPPIGRIALLQDKDGDGRYETRSEFAEGLTYPNGVLSWNGGVIVTCAPDVLFLRDNDGDGRSDERKVLLTGFATNGSTQLRVSHPTFAPDNWIYLSGGLMGGRILSPDHPERSPLDISRNEIRFDPTRGAVEAVDGKGQFGLSFTDFVDRFTCMNRVQIQHVVISGRYLERNPRLTFTDRMQDVPEALDPGLKVGPPAARLFPISRNITTADSHEGTFTAACGVTYYASDGLPPAMHGNAFSCDPAANLVHRDVLEKNGATFTARRPVEPREFLASSDDWFRPVYLQVGPDAALYICDMYRKTIEHPVYLPEEVRKRTDFVSGRDKGRIFKVRRSEVKPKVSLPGNTPSEWVRSLESSNQWTRNTAQRLLAASSDSAIINPLCDLLNRADSPESSYAKARALQLLSAKKSLTREILSLVIRDKNPGVRQVGLRLCEPFLREVSASDFRDLVLGATRDADPHVRFQAALAAGELRDAPAVAKALAALAGRADLDRWTRAAVLSSVRDQEVLLLEEMLNWGNGRLDLISELARMAARTGASERTLLSLLRRAKSPAKLAIFDGWFKEYQSYAAFAGKHFDREKESLEDFAVERSFDRNELPELRETAVQFYRFLPASALRKGFQLLGPGASASLQNAFLESVQFSLEPKILLELLDPSNLRHLSPQLRERAVSALIANPDLTRELLRRIQRGDLAPNLVSPANRRRLRESKQVEIRSAASELFNASADSDRDSVYKDWLASLRMTSNARAGQQVFERVCASCHRLERIGTPVGPDLFSIRNQPKESILLHIINPDLEIASGFNSYTAELRDGRTLTGIIRSETDSAVTFRLAGGEDETIPRADILELNGSTLSMMPRELEKAMSRQEMADLIGFLKGE